ncbi:hypothetical protein [Streptococcus mitis]|nr:hypothetical protein [Streptococcus mitis]
MHKGLDVSIYAKPELFPSPREVDRVFYDKPEFTIEPEGVIFPSPTEVNRVFYVNIVSLVGRTTRFPSPTEVNWVVYQEIDTAQEQEKLFPAPLKVDRYLYWKRRYLSVKEA